MAQQEDRNIFASKFQDFGSMPSDAVWKGIESAIPQKKKRRAVIWWWNTGIAATLLTFGLLTYSHWNGEEKVDENALSGQRSIQTTPAEKNQNSTAFDHVNTMNSVSVEKKGEYLGKNEKKILPKNLEQLTIKHERKVTPGATSEEHKELLANEYINRKKLDSDILVLVARNSDSVGQNTVKDNHANTWVNRIFVGNQLNHRTEDKMHDRVWWVGFAAEYTQQKSVIEKKSEPMASPSAPQSLSTEFDWSRARSLALVGGVDWNKCWSFGTGFEYAIWDNLNASNYGSGPSIGKSVAVPLFVNWHFIAKPRIQVGAQLEFRQRFFYQVFDSVVPPTAQFDLNSEFTLSEPKNYTSMHGYQSQVGFGITTEVPFLKRFSWKTTLLYQNSLYNTGDVKNRINGSWFGVNTGVLYRF